MRSGLFWKLFVLQVLAAGTVLAGALMVTRGLAVRTFGEYLESRERAQVRQLAEDLAEGWRTRHDLGAVVDADPQLAERLRGHGPRALRGGGRREPRGFGSPEAPGGMPGNGPPPPGEFDGREGPAIPGGPGDEPPPPPDDAAGPPPMREPPFERGETRLPPVQLQDAKGNVLRGDPRPTQPTDLREPIEVDGQVVGALVWRRFPSHPAQAEFASRQGRGFLLVGLVALTLAALFAGWITVLIVGPIRRLSAGAAALGRLEFATRVSEDRADELGQLAAEFNRLAGTLEQYDTRQKQWLADIAHELRTPVAVLRGELEALLDGIRPADPAALQSLQDEVGRLSRLIDDLHLLSLAESGGLRLDREPVDASTLANGAHTRFAERFAARGFELSLSLQDGALPVQADVQRIEQVLANLLGNALVHASPPGPVVLRADGDATHLRLSVADAGPGVPDDALPRLFDRLYRVAADRGRKSGGAGLGLSICRSIVEAHGGTISARRSPAGGLEVVVTLPREAA